MALQIDLFSEPAWLLARLCGLCFFLWLATAAWLLWALRQLAEQRKEKRELVAALAGSARHGHELSELRDRLNPHFLFNALNTIRFYARTDAQMARELLLDLSEFLKGVVDSNECGTLAEELDRGVSYLKLEQARLGDRLDLQLEVEEPPVSVAFPTRALQPLLSLLLKRPPGGDPEGWRIAVSCQVEDSVVRLSFSDNRPGPPLGADWIGSWKSRLERHCPGCQVTVEHAGDHTVTITLPKWRNP